MSPGTGRLLHAAGFRVIFMECRGLGESEHKAPFTIQQCLLRGECIKYAIRNPSILPLFSGSIYDVICSPG